MGGVRMGDLYCKYLILFGLNGQLASGSNGVTSKKAFESPLAGSVICHSTDPLASARQESSKHLPMTNSTKKGERMVRRLTATVLLLNGMVCIEAAAPSLAQKADAVLSGRWC